MGIKGSIQRSIRVGRSAIAVTAAITLACIMGASTATAAELAPQTKFRMKVVQWIPVKSAYEEWGALGGEFTVSSNGDIALPVVGQFAVSGMDTQTFAAEVASRLQKQTGLVNKPEVSIEIMDYPPIYVSGDVANPGEYKFREGMTVMQALAVAGGERRATDDAAETLRLVSDLRGSSDEIVRVTARIARLQAEQDGADDVTFPSIPEADTLGAADEIFQRERILFKARTEELERQTKSLTELRDLFNQEIGVLEQKREASEQGKTSAEKELAGVSSLVDKGFAVAARKSEMERIVNGYKTDALDQTTAIMRARQGAAEATRNLDSLQDRRRSDAAREMQDAKAALTQVKLKRDTAQKLLSDLMVQATPDGSNRASLNLSIVRTVDKKATQIDADETTMLLPGDVVSARISASNTGGAQKAAGTSGSASQ
ncbi:MAG: polysaccharide biosynthesis/export family protein [Mesorhizobium sp.]